MWVFFKVGILVALWALMKDYASRWTWLTSIVNYSSFVSALTSTDKDWYTTWCESGKTFLILRNHWIKNKLEYFINPKLESQLHLHSRQFLAFVGFDDSIFVEGFVAPCEHSVWLARNHPVRWRPLLQGPSVLNTSSKKVSFFSLTLNNIEFDTFAAFQIETESRFLSWTHNSRLVD